MTLISVTTNFGHPVMIGDILTTSEAVESELTIPTLLKGVNNLLPENKFIPYKLRQKIYIISDNIAIGLAGLEYEMKTFLDDIKTYFKYKDSTLKNLEYFLDDFDYEEIKYSAYFIIIIENINNIKTMHTRYYGKWTKERSDTYEDVFVCGSGSKDFIREINTKNIAHPSADNNKVFDTLSINSILISRVLLQERLNLSTIKNNWGAGFQIIYYNGNKFVKLNDITYIISSCKLDLTNGEYNALPFLAINYKYHNDILHIASTDFKSQSFNGVLPLYLRKEDLSKDQLSTTVDYDGAQICNIYLIELSDGRFTTMTYFYDRGIRDNITPNDTSLISSDTIPDPGPISFVSDKDGMMALLINDEQDKKIMNEIYLRYSTKN